VPSVSLSVLTPAEIRRLQRDYHDMRNIVLSRAVRCSYEGCGVVYPANDPASMQAHLRAAHAIEKCNFCAEPLFEHWSPMERYRHFVREHAAAQRSFSIPQSDYDLEAEEDQGRTDAAVEGQWRFCPRCGRDHSNMDVPADKVHHGNVCYPGVEDQEAYWVACVVCGEHVPVDLNGVPVGEHVHSHREGVEAEGPFCGGCALPLGRFSREYNARHRSFCRGHGRDNGRYCPKCGVDFGGADPAVCEAHVGACQGRTSSGDDAGVNTATLAYFGQAQQHPPAGQQQRPKSPKRKQPGANDGSDTQTPPQKRFVPHVRYLLTRSATDHLQTETEHPPHQDEDHAGLLRLQVGRWYPPRLRRHQCPVLAAQHIPLQALLQVLASAQGHHQKAKGQGKGDGYGDRHGEE